MCETRIRELLAMAKEGDAEAHREVALYVYNKYRHRVERYFSPDPAASQEDLDSVFFEAVYKSVTLADGRGDDLYHIGQRGVWAVRVEIKTLRALRSKVAYLDVRRDEDDRDPIEALPDPSGGDAYDVVVERSATEDVVRMLVAADLEPSTRRAVDVILSGAAGDPTENGFNARLADGMGVSPQRASQVAAKVEARLRRAQAGYR